MTVVSVKSLASRDTVAVKLSDGSEYEILADDYNELSFLHVEISCISDDELEMLKAAGLKCRMYNSAISKLAYADNTAYMLKRKLLEECRKANIPRAEAEPVCDLICGIFEKKGYIDDYRYGLGAALYLKKKRYGRMRIAQQLRIKGIAKETIDDILQGGEFDASGEDIKALLMKKYGSVTFKNRSDVKKAVAFLLRNGYNYDEAMCYIETDDED